MPVDLKPRLTRLNLDDSFYYLGKEDYVDALNITHDAQEQSEDITNTNITGNRYVPYNKPTGRNVTIGAKEDILRNRVFEFIWNSNDRHSMVIYDQTTDTRTKLIENLTDTNNVDVLQFTLDNKINHVDIIYRGEDEGDLLFWTDGNVTPRKLNVKHIQDGIYTFIQVPFIELAKMPPIKPVKALYGTDATRNSNSLRKKLIMATYRFGCDDFEKTTFTTSSKIPLPIGYYGSDNDIDSTKNNFITFTVETGNENVTDIEIAVRFNIASDWGDYVLAISLNKKQLGILNNVTYDYLFYNDAIYPPFEGGVNEVNQLFDWVPKKAKSQVCGNGNTIELAAITEGYGNYPQSQLDVTITAANQTNIPPDSDPPSITYTISSVQFFFFNVNGSVPTGTFYEIIMMANVPPLQRITIATYTSVPGDTTATVATALNAYVFAHYPMYGLGAFGSQLRVFLPMGSSVLQINVVAGSGGGTISSEKTWLWDANYIFGIAYKDSQGRIMPGVTTFVNPVDSDNDFLVTTPSFSLATSDVQTPVISAAINHLPPADAVTYAWVRRRMTYADFLMYETCDYQDPSDGYLYFCLANIDKYFLDNSQFIYGSAPVTSTSRIKIIAGIAANEYDGDIWNQDYEIIGKVTRTLTGGSSPDDDRLFIKVVKPTAPVSPAYTVNMLTMVYTPMANPTDPADSVYYEWGEEYGIYTGIDSINYHRGMVQDQTASQPATFEWIEGDVYFHQRRMYNNLVTGGGDLLNIMDANWSDFFLSAVNDNGRGITIEVNARETFFPATIRFSREYQQNTNINQTNRFVFENFIDLDRSFGSILRMSIKNRYIRIGQQFKIGSVPLFSQINVDANGNSIRADSDVLLNPVQYYEGDYGVGNGLGYWIDYNFSTYFIDTYRGIECRLSRDGITPISVLYNVNSWVTNHGVITRNIYGAYDPKSNNRIAAFEITDSDPAYTLAFAEGDQDRIGYESFLSYNPEFMCVLGSLLISYKNGDMWAHDGDKYNNFYGVQYPSYINPVFNDQSGVKKKYLGTGYKSLNNVVWASPENGDIITSTVNPQTLLPQISQLKEVDFELEETTLCAGLLCDANSMEDAREALINGDFLGGNYLSIKFICPAEKCSNLVNLSQPYLTWVNSNRLF